MEGRGGTFNYKWIKLGLREITWLPGAPWLLASRRGLLGQNTLHFSPQIGLSGLSSWSRSQEGACWGQCPGGGEYTLLCLVAQLCPTLHDPMGCSPPGSSVHGILQVRILEWVAMTSSRGSSQPRDWTPVSRVAGGFFTIWATREALWYYICWIKIYISLFILHPSIDSQLDLQNPRLLCQVSLHLT